jgi:hypothetical protein
MQHPVFMAFIMDHLDPADRRAVRRCGIRMALAYSALVLLLLAVVAIGGDAPDPQAEAVQRANSTTRQ